MGRRRGAWCRRVHRESCRSADVHVRGAALIAAALPLSTKSKSDSPPPRVPVRSLNVRRREQGQEGGRCCTNLHRDERRPATHFFNGIYKGCSRGERLM